MGPDVLQPFIPSLEVGSATSLGALSITWAAQLGGHSEIHHKIAQFAMAVEKSTFIAVVWSKVLREINPEVSEVLGYLSLMGLIITAGCFAAVALTDENYVGFFKEGGHSIINPLTWIRFFAEVIVPDVVRYSKSAPEHLFRKNS